jgi:hypothetical protein
MSVKPIGYQEHARLSIAHHMQAGLAKNLTGDKLEQYIRKHATPFTADGYSDERHKFEVYEAQLRIALYPPRPKKPRARDLPGQLVAFGIEPQFIDPKKPKRKRA